MTVTVQVIGIESRRGTILAGFKVPIEARWHQESGALAQSNAFQGEIPMSMNHQHYSQVSNHHEFSFDDVGDRAIQDLQGLFPLHFPNFAHDQYLRAGPIFHIQENDRFDLEPIRNPQALAVEYIFLYQNPKDFQ